MTRTVLCLGVLLAACSNDDVAESDSGNEIFVPDEPVAGVESGCGSVRLTTYAAGESGWCEFANTHTILPEFVRQNLTLAIAEPYNGSSYGGDSGEACGECWEIDTISNTQIVMVNNLCPIEGNPLCAGGHFHFDLSREAGEVLGGGGNDEALVRRVPCPVTGSIRAQINDRNEWGYVRLAFVNHRFPIRTAEYRAENGDEWVPVERSGGAWHIRDGGEVFDSDGPGGVFRFTSAAGEQVEGTEVLSYDIGVDSLFDTGAQFDPAEPEGDTCEFVPPANVYDEGWGGIDQMRWMPNPWGDATAAEVTEGCAEESASCVEMRNLAQWAGFHLYYRQPFPTDTFSHLTLQLRVQSGSTEVVVAPSLDGERCEETSATVTEDWSTVEIDVAAQCGGLDELNGVTLSNQGSDVDLLIDEVRFE